MTRSSFDISLIGDKSLRRMLKHLAGKGQRKVVGKAMRTSARRLKNEVLLNLSGGIVEERTGKLVDAMESQKITTRHSRSRGTYTVGLKLPTREALGISPENPYYYPTVLEYGSVKRNIPPLAPFRRTVNAQAGVERRRIGADVGRGITREAQRQT